MRRALTAMTGLMLFGATGALAQDHVVFGGRVTAGAYDPSWGYMVDPSRLGLDHEKIPVDTVISRDRGGALNLRWNSKPGGAWGAAISSPGWLPFDVTLRDTLRLTMYSPSPLAGSELPAVYLEDIHNWHSGKIRLGAFIDGIPPLRWVTASIPTGAFRDVADGIDLSRVKCLFFGQDSSDGNDHRLLIGDVSVCGGSAIAGRRFIIVLGSSTAAGVGADNTDSTWAGMFGSYAAHIDTTMRVMDFAVEDYTTYRLMPDAHVPPLRRASGDLGKNISAALEFHPCAIILSVTSEDVACGYSIGEQMANYDTLFAFAAVHGVPLWITTMQPRRFPAPALRRELAAARDSLVARFDSTGRLIDFWSGFADMAGGLLAGFDSGDGVHPNNAGHTLMFRRVAASLGRVFGR